METLALTGLVPGSIIIMTARRHTQSYKFETAVLEVTETEDMEFLKTLPEGFVLVEPIKVDDRLVRFDAEGINYYFIGNYREKPYLFENVTVERITLPIYGTAHILRCAEPGRRFNRRNNFRVWLGQYCHIALRGSRGQHDAMIKDLSSTGIGLIIKKDQEVNVGDAVEIQFNTEKYNEQREDYEFTLHTLKADIVRVVDQSEKVNLVGCTITEGAEAIEKFVAKKQREKNKVGKKTNDLISMFVGKAGKQEGEQ